MTRNRIPLPLVWVDRLPNLPPSLKALQLDVHELLKTAEQAGGAEAVDLRTKANIDALAAEAQIRGVYPALVIEKAKAESQAADT